MKNVEHKLLELRTIFDEIALSDWLLSGLIAKENSAKEIHSAVTRGIVILSGIENLTTINNPAVTQYNRSEVEEEEIRKVQSRLIRWARLERQSNINSKILNAFLELKRSGHTNITETDIQNKLSGTLDANTFQTNFDQMKNIAERNHGKIFERNMNCIEIWEPVSSFVSEYEQTVFDNG